MAAREHNARMGEVKRLIFLYSSIERIAWKGLQRARVGIGMEQHSMRYPDLIDYYSVRD